MYEEALPVLFASDSFCWEDTTSGPSIFDLTPERFSSISRLECDFSDVCYILLSDVCSTVRLCCPVIHDFILDLSVAFLNRLGADGETHAKTIITGLFHVLPVRSVVHNPVVDHLVALVVQDFRVSGITEDSMFLVLPPTLRVVTVRARMFRREILEAENEMTAGG